jgi:hypothetical protein
MTAEWLRTTLAGLDAGLVLTPERYLARRDAAAASGQPLVEIADLKRESVTSKTSDAPLILEVDTGHASDGLLSPRRYAVEPSALGSAKRRAVPGDVIVSRLRPYLRQVALIDEMALERSGAPIAACSTEFYVLRSRDERSIAFLVPLLLSEPVQSLFAAAQEGGHHPRVPQHVVEQLRIPDSVLHKRDLLSAQVEAAVVQIRRGWAALDAVASSLASDG